MLKVVKNFFIFFLLRIKFEVKHFNWLARIDLIFYAKNKVKHFYWLARIDLIFFAKYKVKHLYWFARIDLDLLRNVALRNTLC